MASNFVERMESLAVQPGELALCWLGQAGFLFKSPAGGLLYLDAYLSDMCETTLGGGILSRRLLPAPMAAEEITRGILVSTHAHQDHHDEETIAAVARRSASVRFGGPVSCLRVLERLGIPPERTVPLVPGREARGEGFALRAVFADHGESEPEAVGILVESEGVRVYHTGDTAYRPERMGEAVRFAPHLVIACINGTAGNLDAPDAARLANDVGARVAIPCHFWFFVGQNTRAEGTPAAFLEACRELAPRTAPWILKPGDPCVYAGRDGQFP